MRFQSEKKKVSCYFAYAFLIVDLELEKNFLDENLILEGDKINDEIMSFH
jgi:hypothetical protein